MINPSQFCLLNLLDFISDFHKDFKSKCDFGLGFNLFV